VTVRVFLLDDHALIRRGIRDLLEPEEDVEVIGEAGTVADALAAIDASPPDVAVVDVRLPDGDGIEACREIRSRHPETRCLVLTSFGDDEAIMNAVVAGANGFLLKESDGAAVIRAIRTVAAGGSLLDPEVTRRVFERLRQAPQHGGRGGLTTQQERLLDLLAEGLTNRQIAERLHLAEKTVRNYVSTLLTELGMSHRTQAALYAAERRRQRPER
jgi:two-component system, NarL family, response regulator DevR